MHKIIKNYSINLNKYSISNSFSVYEYKTFNIIPTIQIQFICYHLNKLSKGISIKFVFITFELVLTINKINNNYET